MMEFTNKEEAGEEMVKYLEGEFKPEQWQYEIADALKTFGARYEQLSCEEKYDTGDRRTQRWHEYFVLSLKKIARDLPPSEELFEAVQDLKREEVKIKAEELGGRAIFPSKNTNANGGSKRSASDAFDEDGMEVSEGEYRPNKRAKHNRHNKRAKNNESGGFTFKTNGAYTIRVKDTEDVEWNYSKFEVRGNGAATVIVSEEDDAPTPPSSHGGRDVKEESFF